MCNIQKFLKMKRDFISILDWTTGEILDNIDFAIELKQKTKEGMCPKLLEGKNYGIFFHKPSLRTRLSFEVGITQLGGSSMVLSEQDFKIGERETVSDVARVMSRYVDGILIRTFSHQMVLDLAKHASVPVINMLTDYNHPCQIMTDIFTVWEHLGELDNPKIVYMGDGNNIVHSWLHLAMRIPMNFVCCCPEDYTPDQTTLNNAVDSKISDIEISHNPNEAIKNADVVYTDVWASMGQKEEALHREKVFSNFQVNEALMASSGKETLFMHCLPAERDREVTDGVMEAEYSIVFDQAENRMHIQNAIMVYLSENN